MSFNKFAQKLIALMMLAGLVIMSLPVSLAATQEQIEAARTKRNELQTQLNEINSRLSEIKDTVKKAQEKADTYEQRTSIVSEQIEVIKQSIEYKTDELELLQQSLELKKQEYDETYTLFKSRVRAMYMNNQSSTLSTLLGASSLTEFLVGAESLRRISEHDTDLMEKLTLEKEEIEEDEKVIEEELASLEEDKEALDAKYNELAELKREADSELSTAEALQEVTQDDYDSILADFNKANSYLDSLMGTGSSEYVGGYYAWPVPGYSYISSPFGWRTLYGKPNYHGGIDIAGSGIYGAPIIASNSGTVKVAYAGWTGYGHYVMIDHGGNNWTVYGHMSKIAVSVGDYVSQGQVIGYVGSTGNSTGPHLHFEIRLNGTKVNPLNYVTR